MTSAPKMCAEEIPELLRKCAHGIYHPSTQEIPWGCSFCRGDDCFADITNPNRKTVRFHKPFGYTLNERDAEFRANQHCPDACPDCGSRFHVVLEDKQWECAECKRVFRGRTAGRRVSDE